MFGTWMGKYISFGKDCFRIRRRATKKYPPTPLWRIVVIPRSGSGPYRWDSGMSFQRGLGRPRNFLPLTFVLPAFRVTSPGVAGSLHAP